MNPEDFENALESSVGECQTKLELVNDYLERFKIKDSRLRAPIYDIERCIALMVHLLHHHSGDNEFQGEMR